MRIGLILLATYLIYLTSHAHLRISAIHEKLPSLPSPLPFALCFLSSPLLPPIIPAYLIHAPCHSNLPPSQFNFFISSFRPTLKDGNPPPFSKTTLPPNPARDPTAFRPHPSLALVVDLGIMLVLYTILHPTTNPSTRFIPHPRFHAHHHVPPIRHSCL